MSDPMWDEMVAFAKSEGLKGGNYKKLNLPFENKILGQSKEIRERMVEGVENFVYDLLINVFNTQDTAPLAMEAILQTGSFDLGPKAKRINDKSNWTEDKIRDRAVNISSDKGPEGDFDD